MSENVHGILIGVNYINSPRELRLRGCWNDAYGLYSLLTSDFDFPVTSLDVLVDNVYDLSFKSHKTSKSNILNSLIMLALKSWSDNLDKVVVSFSGHGTNISDRNGDETDGKDECICPSDCQYAGIISDDELLSIFEKFNPSTRIYVIIDSCHSGSMLDLPYSTNDTSSVSSNHIKEIKPDIVMISGCMDPQVSADAYNYKLQKFGGALTTSIINVLSRYNHIGQLDFHREVCNEVRNSGFPQIPVLSSSKPLTNDKTILM